MSLHVKCRTKQEIDTLHTRLSEGGQILMPLDAYPFSTRFSWITDKYGVSWQLDSRESGRDTNA
jgi:predicted 3-demethylubiquinone-9 3-methyltransferase (glyoxalase superfamily)